MTEEEFRSGVGVVHGEPSRRYIADALTTLSPQWHGKNVPKVQFTIAISNAIAAINKLDALKKVLFYGKENTQAYNGSASVEQLPTRVGSGGDNGVNTIHAIIGIVTEAGELLEALRNDYDNPASSTMDAVNIREEIGDLFWYVAILANECGFSFEDAQRVNIAKLKARYPDKFNSNQALERNLSNERKILEKGVDIDIANS